MEGPPLTPGHILAVILWRPCAEPESQRAGELILFDKQPLSRRAIEGNPPGTRCKKPASKTFKIPLFSPHSLPQSPAVIILFTVSLLPSEERLGKSPPPPPAPLDLNLLNSEFHIDDIQL